MTSTCTALTVYRRCASCPGAAPNPPLSCWQLSTNSTTSFRTRASGWPSRWRAVRPQYIPFRRRCSVRWYSSSSLRWGSGCVSGVAVCWHGQEGTTLSRVWMYLTWAAIESCSSAGRDAEEMPARPGPVTRDICVVGRVFVDDVRLVLKFCSTLCDAREMIRGLRNEPIKYVVSLALVECWRTRLRIPYLIQRLFIYRVTDPHQQRLHLVLLQQLQRAVVGKMEPPAMIGFWGGMALLISSITGPGLTTSLLSNPQTLSARLIGDQVPLLFQQAGWLTLVLSMLPVKFLTANMIYIGLRLRSSSLAPSLALSHFFSSRPCQRSAAMNASSPGSNMPLWRICIWEIGGTT